jgi:5-methylcytosine-specific restriction endonuclease McrA
LARVITRENSADVLPRFFHASKQEAKAVAAEILPAEVVPRREMVTTVSVPAARAVVFPGATVGAPDSEPAAIRQVGAEVLPVELAPALPPRPAPLVSVQPLTAEARRLHVTVSKRFLEKLEVAREALSHSHPGADAEAILEAGLDLLIERAAKKKGLSTRPRAERAAPKIEAVPSKEEPPPSARPPAPRSRPRHIPADVRREVWLRDEGRCQFRLESGEICGSTHRLQFDHVHPFSLGGKSTVRNIRLACADHNLLAARLIFGDALMDRYAPVRSSQTPAASP